MTNGKTVWITGASSGIGEALAYEFVAQGDTVILSSRRADELERVRGKCIEIAGRDDRAHVLTLDVIDFDAMDAKVEAAKAFTGRIDMLINNAGISQRSLCLETDMAAYRKLFEVDVFGQIALTKAVLPVMVEQGSGHVAVTASVAGKVGAPYRTGYCAAKHAMMGFFDALRAEMSGQNIQVTTITPGFIRTNIAINAIKGDGSQYAKQDGNIEGGMDVTDAAKVIMKGFRKGKNEIAVGKGIEMHALWIKRFFPGLLLKMVNKTALPKTVEEPNA